MEFKSKSGIKYFFDNDIGIAYPSHPNIEKMIGNTSRIKEDISTLPTDDDSLFYLKFLQKLDKIRPKQKPKRQSPILPGDARKMVFRDGLYQMILGITEDCNLRCRYCVYSDAYTLTRKPSKQVMDFKTAKKALDHYASLIREGRQYNPVRRPAVGFYGGEPLLNFHLIQECVHYLKTTCPDIDFFYSLTTNGTLLTKEKEDFLKEHGFTLTISIDGPKNEHDRKRVYPNGEGTFDDVMKNVRRYITTGYEKCMSICVFDYKSDLFSLDAFFSRSDIPKLSLISLPSDQDGCVYYDQFTEEDIENYRALEERTFQYYLDHITEEENRHSVFEQFYPVFASRLLYTIPVMVMPEDRVIPYSGACILGRKIFVDAHGNFHPCERINHFFPIGNAWTGLDFSRIASIMNDYNKHLESCATCSISKACGYCYNHFAKDGYFDSASDVCKEEEKIKKWEFSKAFTIGEKHPLLLDILVKDYYSWLSKVSPTLGD